VFAAVLSEALIVTGDGLKGKTATARIRKKKRKAFIGRKKFIPFRPDGRPQTLPLSEKDLC